MHKGQIEWGRAMVVRRVGKSEPVDSPRSSSGIDQQTVAAGRRCDGGCGRLTLDADINTVLTIGGA